jgi:HD-like signal output (HDOD) protein
MFSWFRRRRQDPRKELLGALGSAELPTFPPLLTQILQDLRAEDLPLTKIGQRVGQDPTLTVKVLKTVNSAGFGLRRRVESVPHAVTLLGRARLESIILPLAVGEALPAEGGPGFEPRRFWHAAARRAAVARGLAHLLDPSSRDLSYTAGLLQDMAIPLLVHNRPDSYGPVLERWHAGEGPLHELEREAFGWTHADVAGWLCADWGLPEPLAAAITAHHGASDPELQAPAPVRLVALLDEAPDDALDLKPLLTMASEGYKANAEQVMEIISDALGGAGEVARLFAA